MGLKTWYVPYGHGQDRDVIRVKACTAESAQHLAYLQVGPINGAAQPAKPVITTNMIRTIKSMRKHNAKWSEIAWHLSISVPTVKKYFKLTLDKSR
jgi:hypothetical protein